MFETIKLENRQLHNLWYHSRRMQQSQHDLLGMSENVDLEQLIAIPDWVGEGIYRCRLSYRNEIEKIDYFPYAFKHPKLIELVEDKAITYPYKYEDRQVFSNLLLQYPLVDEVIVMHDGYLTDASFANLAFYDGNQWFTPLTFLLRGTKRQYLIDNHQLIEASICINDLKDFRKIALINAMRGLDLAYDFSINQNQIVIHEAY